jgi:hypothetical protein
MIVDDVKEESTAPDEANQGGVGEEVAQFLP